MLNQSQEPAHPIFYHTIFTCGSEYNLSYPPQPIIPRPSYRAKEQADHEADPQNRLVGSILMYQVPVTARRRLRTVGMKAPCHKALKTKTVVLLWVPLQVSHTCFSIFKMKDLVNILVMDVVLLQCRNCKPAGQNPCELVLFYSCTSHTRIYESNLNTRVACTQTLGVFSTHRCFC